MSEEISTKNAMEIIKKAYVKEKSCSVLFPFERNAFETLRGKLVESEIRIRADLQKPLERGFDNIKNAVREHEIERVRYFLTAYHQIRLKKMEKSFDFLLRHSDIAKLKDISDSSKKSGEERNDIDGIDSSDESYKREERMGSSISIEKQRNRLTDQTREFCVVLRDSFRTVNAQLLDREDLYRTCEKFDMPDLYEKEKAKEEKSGIIVKVLKEFILKWTDYNEYGEKITLTQRRTPGEILLGKFGLFEPYIENRDLEVL
ncbi:hypothetical protein ADUPG1_013824 [Aduncisulcus paluster]|uniref:Uncharacterized protein n=1 Tax=Aduncisulcus paluster TaxID=2918883 RepID=A0ABQ5K7K2_9EUKA|nr:hypothetical protein ADUPG1_013824 [Aduncisulcus paluster]